jgi:hypothetical protein
MPRDFKKGSKLKKRYKHGGRQEYEGLHNLSQKEYDKTVGETSYKHGGKLKSRSIGGGRHQHD